MLGVRLRRLFWIGAAVLLGVAALVALIAVARGEFTDTDGKILGTLGASLLAGSSCLAGLALVERRQLVPLGWFSVAGGIAGFIVLTVEIWREFDGDTRAASALVLLVAALMITTSRLLLRSERIAWLLWIDAALVAAAASATVIAIERDFEGNGWDRLVGSLWIVAVLGWFLIPVLGRTHRASPGAPRERVVGRGPGHVEVDLNEGETLVVRRS